MEQQIRHFFQESIGLKQRTLLEKEIATAAGVILERLRAGKKIMVCGNGGSMEQAMHFCAELTGKYRMKRGAIRAHVLGIDPVAHSAWANDFDYATAFAREVEAFGHQGDVLVGLSTSGNSQNVIEAVAQAKKHDITTIGLLGQGGALKDMVDIPLCVPSRDTARIQEVHLLIIHIMSHLIEEELFA